MWPLDFDLRLRTSLLHTEKYPRKCPKRLYGVGGWLVVVFKPNSVKHFAFPVDLCFVFVPGPVVNWQWYSIALWYHYVDLVSRY